MFVHKDFIKINRFLAEDQQNQKRSVELNRRSGLPGRNVWQWVGPNPKLGENMVENRMDYETRIACSSRCAVQGQIQAAEEYAQQAVGIDPASPEAFNLLGACCEIHGKHLEAQKYYRAALAFDPSYPPAQHNLDRLVEKIQGPVDLGKE